MANYGQNVRALNWKPIAINIFIAVAAFVIGGLWGYESGEHAGRKNAADSFVNDPFDALRSTSGEDPIIARTRRGSAASTLEFEIDSHVRPENRDSAKSYFSPLIERLKN